MPHLRLVAADLRVGDHVLLPDRYQQVVKVAQAPERTRLEVTLQSNADKQETWYVEWDALLDVWRPPA